MALTESRFRQIIKEEARRVLREGAGKTASMGMVARELRNMGEDDLADKIERYNSRSGGNAGMEFDERGDGVVKAYEHENGRSGNYMFDIPTDIYRKLKPLLTDKRMSESRSKRVVLEGEFDDFGGAEELDDPLDGDEEMDEEMTVQGVIEQYKDEGPRSWMRVSNDFNEMADGGMEDIARKYYPGLTPDDFRTIVRTLDRHFGMD